MSSSAQVRVETYRDEFRDAFERLNREWIEQHFRVEPPDAEVFRDPHGTIVAPGGQIFFVVAEGEVLATCAAVRHSAVEYELAKMAVAPPARGQGYSDLLMRAVIEFAGAAGAEVVTILSNTKLVPAIRLYEKYGFERVPLEADSGYERADIKLQLRLTDADG